MKKLLLIAIIVLPLATTSAALAVTMQPSDYQQDVTAGQKELASDQVAKNQAGEVGTAEHADGQVDNGEATVEQTVGEQESNMGDKEGGESVHGDAQVTVTSDGNGSNVTNANGSSN